MTRGIGYLEEDLTATGLTFTDADLRELAGAYLVVWPRVRYDATAAGFTES